MSSKQFALAFSLHSDVYIPQEQLEARLNATTEYAKLLLGSKATFNSFTQGNQGIAHWEVPNGSFEWPSFSQSGPEAAIWLHIPSSAGAPANGKTARPLEIANEYKSRARATQEMGAPCALIHLNQRELFIINDQLGMARIFEFRFPDFGTVWTTRSSLAHIFALQEPKSSRVTWSSMNTIGWSVSGGTQLGDGEQLRGGTCIRSVHGSEINRSSNLVNWLESTVSQPPPSPKDLAESMVNSLEIAKWWNNSPTFDLSGGKDSRVTAAAGICAGVVNSLRTSNTDVGEVETAQSLVSLVGMENIHRITEATAPKTDNQHFLTRYSQLHKVYEGNYLARSAMRAVAPSTLRVPGTPKVNGLGGEAMQGGNFQSNSWKERISNQGSQAARLRLSHLVSTGGFATTSESRELTQKEIGQYIEQAAKADFTGGSQILDYFYNFGEMPNWSIPTISPGILLPFYSPVLLSRIAHSIARPLEHGILHKELLKHLIPGWADIPFYKGSIRTRVHPWPWENDQWLNIKTYILDNVSSLDSHNPEEVRKAIENCSVNPDPRLNNRFEILISRLLWDLTFQDFNKDLGSYIERLKPKS